MKLVRVAVNFQHNGGVTRYIHELVPLLCQNGLVEYHVTFLPGDLKLPHASSLYCLTGDVEWNTSTIQKQFRAILEEIKPDLIQFHDTPVPALVETASEYAPTIVMYHGYGPTCPGTQYFYAKSEQVCERQFGLNCLLSAYVNRCNNRHPKRLLRSYLRTAYELKHQNKADLYLVHSGAQRDALVNNGYQRNRIELSPGVVNAENFGAHTSQYNDLILFVGRLSSVKGVQYLLKAMHAVKKPAQVVIIGDGNYRSHLEELAANVPKRHEVIFTGWLNDEEMSNWYSQAGMAVVPSIWMETFGMTGLEAMASRLPVIGSDIGGIPGWLEHGKNGFLVQPKNVQQLTGRIEQLLQDKRLAAQMGTLGREMVEEHFTAERESKRLLKIYSDVANSRA